MTLEINIFVRTNMYMRAYTIFFLSNKHKIEWVYKGMLQLLHKTIDASKHSLKHLPQLKYTTQFHKNLVPINLTHSLLNLQIKKIYHVRHCRRTSCHYYSTIAVVIQNQPLLSPILLFWLYTSTTITHVTFFLAPT